jgi:hypothetical protein
MTVPTKTDIATPSTGNRGTARTCPVTRQKDHSQLTPELKEFIDRLVVPILVKKYIEAAEGAEGLADPAKFAAHSVCDTGYSAPGKAMP